jgi:multiple antibiotic resistance protein
MSLVAYCFLALSSLFVIVDPIATIPAFIAMTPRDSVASRLNQAQDWPQRIALLISIVAVSFASYLILRLSAQGARWLNPLAIKLITRLMGLLLAAIAVQFALNGLEQTALFHK